MLGSVIWSLHASSLYSPCGYFHSEITSLFVSSKFKIKAAIQSKRKYIKIGQRRLMDRITDIPGKEEQTILDIEKVCKSEARVQDFRALF